MDASYADAAGSTLRAGDKVQLVGTNKTGKCRFVGAVPFSDGIWVGLELGDASGRNDGSVQGRRYFSCKPRHGLFVRVSSCIKSSGPSTTTTPVRDGPASASVDQKTVDVSLGGSSTADVMLERIQTILGSARKPSSSSSSSTARTILSAPVPPIPMLRVDSAPAPIVDSGALLKDVLDSPVLQERIKKLVVAAVTTAIAASTPTPTTTPTPTPAPTPAPSSSAATAAGKLAAETAAVVAGLEGRIAAMETAFDRIKAGLDDIQSLVSVSVKSAHASLSSTPSRVAMKTPPRSRTDMGTETDSSSDNAAEVMRLREALEVVSRLTREAQAGILAERTKRKEETEALLTQLSKVKSSPSR